MTENAMDGRVKAMENAIGAGGFGAGLGGGHRLDLLCAFQSRPCQHLRLISLLNELLNNCVKRGIIH